MVTLWRMKIMKPHKWRKKLSCTIRIAKFGSERAAGKDFGKQWFSVQPIEYNGTCASPTYYRPSNPFRDGWEQAIELLGMIAYLEVQNERLYICFSVLHVAQNSAGNQCLSANPTVNSKCRQWAAYGEGCRIVLGVESVRVFPQPHFDSAKAPAFLTPAGATGGSKHHHHHQTSNPCST